MREQIEALLQSSPEAAQAVQQIEAALADTPATSEGLQELIEMFEFALQNPQAYPQILEAAVADGLLDPEDMPPEFSAPLVIALLAVLYRMQQGAGAAGFAQGGLASLGRGGDTMLAHINPREAAILKQLGGSGDINPHTGLREFGFLKNIIKKAAPIAAVFAAPYLAPLVGGNMLVAHALSGALGAGLSGGNVAQGALMGGLSGGLGGALGGAANTALGIGLGEAGTAALGNALVGGLAGAATGQGLGRGAIQGLVGGQIGQMAGGAESPLLRAGGRDFGRALTAGFNPRDAVAIGGLSGLAAAMAPAGAARGPVRASETVLDGMRGITPATDSMSNVYKLGVEDTLGSGMRPMTAAATGAPGMADSLGQGVTGELAARSVPVGGLPRVSAGQALLGAAALGGMGAQPPAAAAAVQRLSPQQQEYFNRPSQNWDWGRMQRDAAAAGMGLAEFMSAQWPAITAGQYTAPAQQYANGGGVLARLARGAGSGRADTIDARLSDGEYVMDAETVAMLGDGSTEEGARRLEAMRQNLRRHKGRALARGKFSPNAKSPLDYMKGAA